MHAIEVGEGNAQTVTFGAPRAGNSNHLCSARRYFLTSTSGDDPVPMVPPWADHPHTGKELNQYLEWFSLKYRINDVGCGSNEGGGINMINHLQWTYEWYMWEVLGRPD